MPQFCDSYDSGFMKYIPNLPLKEVMFICLSTFINFWHSGFKANSIFSKILFGVLDPKNNR